IDAHRQTEQWLLRRADRLALERHRHGGDEVVLRVVGVDLAAEEAALAALGDDEDAGLVHDGLAAQRPRGAHEANAVENRRMDALTLRELSEQFDEASHGRAVYKTPACGRIRQGFRSFWY